MAFSERENVYWVRSNRGGWSTTTAWIWMRICLLTKLPVESLIDTCILMMSNYAEVTVISEVIAHPCLHVYMNPCTP